MASPAKKPRTDTKAKSFYAKQARKGSKNSIEVGDKGFLVTCNFREKDSTREVYRLLNEYYSKLHKEDEDKAAKEVTVPDDGDIESQLKNEIEKTAKETKEKAQKFQSVETGVQNLIFIKTTIDDPRSLAESIIRDLAETKVKKTKVTLRMLPVETVCKVKILTF
jgi:tRNA acetyltransferase TAN1